MPRYLILDTETTGLGPDAKIVDLAWIEVDEAMKVIDRFETLVDPEIPISPGASAKHGIVAEDVADAPTIEEVFSVLLSDPIEDVCLCGHNCQFDFRYVRPYLGITSQLCTLRAARRYFPKAENHKLETLKYVLGLRRDQTAHRAMGDVEVTYELLEKIFEVSGLDLPGLVEEMGKPVLVDSLPFGKYKGVSLMKCPGGYLRWLKESTDLDPDLKVSVELVWEKRFGRRQ